MTLKVQPEFNPEENLLKLRQIAGFTLALERLSA